MAILVLRVMVQSKPHEIEYVIIAVALLPRIEDMNIVNIYWRHAQLILRSVHSNGATNGNLRFDVEFEA